MKLVITSLLFISIIGCFAGYVCAEDTYRIGPEDELQVTVIGKQEYRLIEKLAVNATGNILLSIMSEEFQVNGLTCPEIDTKLTEVLAKDYLLDPEVLVEVTEYNSHKILVIGEVKNPGELILQKERLDLKEILINTGGPVGDMNKTIVVIHSDSDSSIEPTIVQMDQVLMDAVQKSIFVGSDDIVYVLGKDKELPMRDTENVVYVFGQVSRPGLIPYNENLTTLRAILNAGNFTSEAAPGRTFIKRVVDNKITQISVNLDKVMSGGDKEADVPIQPGDVIYVPRAIF